MEPLISKGSSLVSTHFSFITISAPERVTMEIPAMLRNTYSQPRFCVMIPPIDGPAAIEIYTVVTFIPKAIPRSFEWKTEVTIAVFVQIIIALPIPCNILNTY